MEAALKLVEQPDTVEIETKTDLTIQKAEALQIQNEDAYRAASEMLLGIKDLLKEIKGTFEPIKTKAHAAWKEVVAQQQKHEEPLLKAETILKSKMGTYYQEQERLRLEEEARLREIARKKEEEERLALAIQAEREGCKEEAEAILEEPVFIPPVIAPSITPKVSGIAPRKSWDFEIVNPKLVPDQYKIVDTKVIAGVVRSLGERTQIPGVKVFQTMSIAAGRR